MVLGAGHRLDLFVSYHLQYHLGADVHGSGLFLDPILPGGTQHVVSRGIFIRRTSVCATHVHTRSPGNRRVY